MKQLDFTNWEKYIYKRKKNHNDNSEKNKKPKLAFGYGYDPKQLASGINNYEFSHDMDDGRKLYTFKPKLPYRIYPLLSKIIDYKLLYGSILKKATTEIQNNYFITDKDPEHIIKEINDGIKKIIDNYEPAKN